MATGTWFLSTQPAFSRNRIFEIAFRTSSICFAGPITRFLYITGPRKQLEGIQLEKEGPFPAGHPGRSTGSVSNMAHPFKLTLVYLKVWLFVPHYGYTSALPSEWLEGVELWNTLLDNP